MDMIPAGSRSFVRSGTPATPVVPRERFEVPKAPPEPELPPHITPAKRERIRSIPGLVQAQRQRAEHAERLLAVTKERTALTIRNLRLELSRAHTEQRRLAAELDRLLGADAERAEAENRRTPRSAWQRIAREVSLVTGVSLKEMRSSWRATHICAARHEAWWRMRHELSLSYPQIGRLWGRDHTTILNGVRKHQARIDAGLAGVVVEAE